MHEQTAAPWSPASAPKATYEIDARVDIENGAIDGTQTVSLANESSEAIRSLRIVWSGEADRALDVGSRGNLETLDEGIVALHLGDPVAPGGRVALPMSFRGPIEVLDWHPRLDWGGTPAFDRYTVKVRGVGDLLVIATGCRRGARSWWHTRCSRSDRRRRSEERRVGKECRSRWSPDH